MQLKVRGALQPLRVPDDAQHAKVAGQVPIRRS
jgi:hypothetical protein